ncbi:hypothetical protein BGX33_002052 [Mortierella sp. NVP41]|nr:hypothetical protein BGX33_002052 [Mortierella sp. NVP41]
MVDVAHGQRHSSKKSFFFLPSALPAPLTPTSPPSPITKNPKAMSSSYPGPGPNLDLLRETQGRSTPPHTSMPLFPLARSPASTDRLNTPLQEQPQQQQLHQQQPYTLAASAISSPGDTQAGLQSLATIRSMDHFVVLQELGKGSFGSVFKAQHKVSGEMALEALRAGPNIVRLHQFFLEKKELYMVFELMDGNLYQLIKDRNGIRLEELKIRSIVFQILRGLQHMHSKGIMHRDMKPENLLVTGDCVKIADFGLARELKSRPPYTTYVSTRWYRAPEVLLKSSAYTSAVDLWATGTIAAELISLKPLFPGSSDVDQINRIGSALGSPSQSTQEELANGTITTSGSGGEWKDGVQLAAKIGVTFPPAHTRSLQDLLPSASGASIDFISGLLKYDPKSRTTAYQSLLCPWFEGIPEIDEVRLLVDIQHSPDKRRSMFSGLRSASFKKESKEGKDAKEGKDTKDTKDTKENKARKRGLSVTLPSSHNITKPSLAMILKPDSTIEALQRSTQAVHLHSGFDLPEISPTSPFWNDTHA